MSACAGSYTTSWSLSDDWRYPAPLGDYMSLPINDPFSRTTWPVVAHVHEERHISEVAAPLLRESVCDRASCACGVSSSPSLERVSAYVQGAPKSRRDSDDTERQDPQFPLASLSGHMTYDAPEGIQSRCIIGSGDLLLQWRTFAVSSIHRSSNRRYNQHSLEASNRSPLAGCNETRPRGEVSPAKGEKRLNRPCVHCV